MQYPPELAYPPVSHTNEPAVVLRETGSSRIAYFPGDIERTYWLTGHGDLLRLLHNTIRWITRDESVVHVHGEGFIEMFAGRPPRLRRSPAQLHQPQRAPRLDAVDLSSRPADCQHEAAARSEGKIRRTPADRTQRSLPEEGQTLRFTIPHVEDYEVAGISVE